ncbi:ABC transporter ATP-binding protein [Novosphingobium sp. TH158]|uniref:ABC transporter ATP-binding protein n=1 Tax=Novosphingobium sp. TH158 TaxID=2067455 RepID=UPI000C7E6A41|nr:ABC transporter ATP-binding protein [Novosphingobium sp. TH158]PLK26984.1 ABC transporter ATP-binding protein [Novosphingobium sp. TH158]
MELRAENLVLPGRLDGISLSVRTREVTAIVGPNGAGKSSLLACLAGLLDPASGTVSLNGRDLHSLEPRDRARRIGFLPQSPEIAWDVTVETLVSLGRLPWQGSPLHVPHATAAEDAAAIEKAIAAMDLAPLRHRPVSRLSGGERAQALAARVLAGEPALVLADEPLANLDLAHAAALMRLLRAEVQARRGVVLVLHDLATAMNRADRVVVLDQGRIVADGMPEQALDADTVSRVWQVRARWTGEPGAQALSVD